MTDHTAREQTLLAMGMERARNAGGLPLQCWGAPVWIFTDEKTFGPDVQDKAQRAGD